MHFHGVLLIFRRSGYLRHKKSMDVHHPHSEVVGITVNPDKSRPCIMHRHLRLILWIEQLLKFPTFQSVPNKSKRLLIIRYVTLVLSPKPCLQGVISLPMPAIRCKVSKKRAQNKI